MNVETYSHCGSLRSLASFITRGREEKLLRKILNYLNNSLEITGPPALTSPRLVLFQLPKITTTALESELFPFFQRFEMISGKTKLLP